MHPLTKLIYDKYGQEYYHNIEEIVQSWAKEQSEWFLSNYPNASQEFKKHVYQAFQLQPPKLREKIVNSINMSSLFPKLEEHGIIDMFVKIAEEHFKK